MLAAAVRQMDIPEIPQLFTGIVTETAGDYWVVNNSFHCGRATGCLLEPEPNDTVLCCEAGDGTRYVLSVLLRPDASEARLSVDGMETVSLCSPRLNLTSTREMNLNSLRNMRFNAALGNLHLHAQNMFSTASDSFIQTAENYIGKMTQYSLTALGMLRQHGRHQIVTADQDVRIDGERITMG